MLNPVEFLLVFASYPARGWSNILTFFCIFYVAPFPNIRLSRFIAFFVHKPLVY